MDIIDFRFLTTDDTYDVKYGAWSRIYEYPYVLEQLKKLGATSDSLIHNTSWGYEGCHVTFKNDLDTYYTNTLHSDIKSSSLKNTMMYDICKKIDDKYLNYFDFVLNISTVEEVNHPNNLVIKNLYEQVKPGGYLIVTFDYSKGVHNNLSSFGKNSINLEVLQNLLERKICDDNSDKNINGGNSVHIETNSTHLNCGVLVIKK